MPRAPLLLLCCLLLAPPAWSQTVRKVEITGVDEEAADNVRSALSLSDVLGRPVSERRLGWLLRNADDEAREALEPFGYYDPAIEVSNARSGSGEAQQVDVTIAIRAGEPVRVDSMTVEVGGEAAGIGVVSDAVAAFGPRPGEVFDHQRYEDGKGRIAGALASRGYFDAQALAQRVEVTRATRQADIDLRWDSGTRYALGEVTFVQEPRTVIRPSLLAKVPGWQPGEAYDARDLDRLYESLARLDYFGVVSVEPDVEAARSDGSRQVPVRVALTPAPRSIYTAGASYGTESGAGVRLGVERRYLNSRGHKALAQLDYANYRKTLTLQYRVPAFLWRDGWYTGTLQAADEQTDFLSSRRVEFVASRSGQFNDYLNLVASVHALRERWQYIDVEASGDSQDDADRVYSDARFANFLYPSLRAEYLDADNKLFPRDALGGTLTLRGGLGGDEEREPFAQLHLTTSWFKGLGEEDRLIVRGEAGWTYSDALLLMPPSLRFFAGGDRSIRGYGWREVGPRIVLEDGRRYATGARSVITASVEYERYFRGPWGAAVFVDTGSAFNGRKPDLHTGVGVGLRWKSPVGPVRLDIARGLDDPASPFTLHLNIGADLL